MSKYNDMKEHYEKRIEDLCKEVEHYRDRYLNGSLKYTESVLETERKYNAALGKIELYKELINKFYGEHSLTTDTMFMFEGKLYRPANFDLHREPREPDTLTVEFVAVPEDI